MTTIPYIDGFGNPIAVGSRVSGVVAATDHGVITAISDPDGDVDDYGRGIAINPRVSVRFDDGGEDEFATCDTRRWYDEDEQYQCDDVEAIVTGCATAVAA